MSFKPYFLLTLSIQNIRLKKDAFLAFCQNNEHINFWRKLISMQRKTQEVRRKLFLLFSSYFKLTFMTWDGAYKKERKIKVITQSNYIFTIFTLLHYNIAHVSIHGFYISMCALFSYPVGGRYSTVHVDIVRRM